MPSRALRKVRDRQYGLTAPQALPHSVIALMALGCIPLVLGFAAEWATIGIAIAASVALSGLFGVGRTLFDRTSPLSYLAALCAPLSYTMAASIFAVFVAGDQPLAQVLIFAGPLLAALLTGSRAIVMATAAAVVTGAYLGSTVIVVPLAAQLEALGALMMLPALLLVAFSVPRTQHMKQPRATRLTEAKIAAATRKAATQEPLAPLKFHAGGSGASLTERKTAAGSAEAKRNEPSVLFPDLMTVHNRTGNVTAVMGASQDILDGSPDCLRDGGFFHRVHVADRPAFLNALDQAWASEETAAVELRLRCNRWSAGAYLDDHDAGTTPHYQWIEMRIRRNHPYTDLIALSRSVDNRVAERDALKKSREAVERNAMTTTRFLASVSHELRTPLNAIIGFSELLQHNFGTPLPQETRDEYAKLISESGRHLLDVVNGILDMSKLEAGRFEIQCEPFDVETFVPACLHLVGPGSTAHAIEIRTDIAPDLPVLNADQRACKQIIVNLLSNAMKFSPENGVVDLIVKQENEHLRFSVRDRGIGMSASDMERIGEPFFQARPGYDAEVGGTGLGLSVVKGLVVLHEGTFSVESTPGIGTTVHIDLPIAGPAQISSPDVSADVLSGERSDEADAEACTDQADRSTMKRAV